MDEGLSQQEPWRSYGYLTGLKQPHINALRYSAGPILYALSQLKSRTPKLEVHCYQDLSIHIGCSRLSERLLLLETAERVRRRISIEEWRCLLSEELECSINGFVKAMENLAEWVRNYHKSVVLYSGFVMPLKEYLKRGGFEVELVYLQHYWRSPLDALRIMIWAHGINNISDNIIIKCVKDQLRYLDYVISSRDIDAAHRRWRLETIYFTRKRWKGSYSFTS